MKTTDDLLDRMYPLVNTSTIAAMITGRVYRTRKPNNSKAQDIVLVPLVVKNGEPIQQGTIIVNCFAANRDNGLPNEAKLNEVTRAVISVIEAGSAATTYFDIKIDSQAIIRDVDDLDMSYASIRTTVTIEK
jgi:alkyl hydroperoxide reductase subunit AhpF